MDRSQRGMGWLAAGRVRAAIYVCRESSRQREQPVSRPPKAGSCGARHPNFAGSITAAGGSAQSGGRGAALAPSLVHVSAIVPLLVVRSDSFLIRPAHHHVSPRQALAGLPGTREHPTPVHNLPFQLLGLYRCRQYASRAGCARAHRNRTNGQTIHGRVAA